MCLQLHSLTGAPLDPHLCVPPGARCDEASTQAGPSRLLLVSGGADHAVMLWDVAEGACLQRLASHTSPVTALLVSGCLVISLAGKSSLAVLVSRFSLVSLDGSNVHMLGVACCAPGPPQRTRVPMELPSGDSRPPVISSNCELQKRKQDSSRVQGCPGTPEPARLGHGNVPNVPQAVCCARSR